MNAKITLHLADGNTLELNGNSIIQPISLIQPKDEAFTSIGEPIILENHYHSSAAYVPIITEILATNEFFMILRDNDHHNPEDVYQSCTVVKISHE